MLDTLPKPRIERLFGKPGPTERELINQASPERRDIQCSKCHGLLTLIKVSKRKNDYETTTYQCHNQKFGKMCLEVHTITDSVPFYMRPEDLDSGDAGWQQAAPQTVPAADVEHLVRTKKVAPKAVFEGVKHRPVYPGNKATLNKVIFDYFWSSIMSKKLVDKAKLEAFVRANVKTDRTKVDHQLSTLTVWITERTGYAIALNDGLYTVVGRTVGGKGIPGLPYSDPSYQKLHGFTV